MAPNTRPLVENLAGDSEIAGHFAAAAEVSAILRFETELAAAQASLGLVPAEAAEALADADERLRWPWAAREIRDGMRRDGVPVPALVRALRQEVGAHGVHVHHGATSQDAVDTGLMLRLRSVIAILGDRLDALVETLDALRARDGAVPVMAQTRMQAALPFTAADKIATWRRPLAEGAVRLRDLAGRLPVQLGGPIGTGASFGPEAAALRAALARRLRLRDAEPWHADRTPVLDVAQLLALLTGTLGKIGQDLVLLAQSDRGAIVLPGGGGSSAMAHKNNPVGAEVLVALGRLNAGLLGTLAQSMISENERSGAAWTLEWMVLPQMAEAAGAALRLAGDLLSGAEFRAP